MLDEYYNQMLEFLKMDTEITFKQFDEYYKQVSNQLSRYEGFDQEESLFALFIMDNLKSNSDSRVQRRFPEAKKYRKISERSKIWIEALFIHLTKLGLSEQEITEKIEQMYELA
jgi:hypothetical protein